MDREEPKDVVNNKPAVYRFYPMRFFIEREQNR